MSLLCKYVLVAAVLDDGVIRAFVLLRLWIYILREEKGESVFVALNLGIYLQLRRVRAKCLG